MTAPAPDPAVPAPYFADLLLAAKLSDAAYFIDADAMVKAVQDLGLVFRCYVPTARCALLIAYDSADTAYIAFQGTRVEKNSDPAEWLVDIEVEPLDLGAGRLVTSGAWSALQEVAPVAIAELKKRAPTRIRLTGHSLGGWYAHLMQETLTRAGIPHDPAITFGAPKCGNAAFWQSLPAPLRVVAKRDFAPDWAPRPPWVQPSRQLWLDGTGWSFTEHRQTLNLSIPDHSIDGDYIPLLQALAS